jgi:pyruvate,water dikinase
LIAETGSPLAHLAILAREAGIATVVRVADAVNRYPEGIEVELDGATGQIKLVEGTTADPGGIQPGEEHS